MVHIVMFPWFAMGHSTPFLHLANQLAERGNKITLLLPNKAKLLLDPYNLHPSLITLRPINVPHVDPLPPGCETTADVPFHLETHLATAMDLTRPELESAIASVMPADFLFYDFSPWANHVANHFGLKSVCYIIVSAASIAIALVPARNRDNITQPPPGYPSKTIVFRGNEVDNMIRFIDLDFGSGLTFYERNIRSMMSCDAIALRTTKEMEASFCDYLANQYNKPILLTGPVLPKSGFGDELDPKWADWLDQFEPSSVVFCTFGSQFVLDKDQFQELLLGFEMTSLPFLVSVKPPKGCSTVEEALPVGFIDRVGKNGVVHEGWIQQPRILAHPSVGCFVSHCGFSSMWESLLSECQIVLVPQLGDQILNTRLMADELKVAVEVEKESNGWISKESLCRAIKITMDEESQVGDLVRKNHAKWRQTLLSPSFISDYIDNFVDQLQLLLG